MLSAILLMIIVTVAIIDLLTNGSATAWHRRDRPMSPQRKIFAGDRAAVLRPASRSAGAIAAPPQHGLGVALAVLPRPLFSIWWLGIAIEEIGPGLAALAKSRD